MIRLAYPDKYNTRLLQRVYEKYPKEKPLECWFEELKESRAFLFEQSKELPTIDYAGLVEIREDCLQARVGGGLDGRMDVLEMFKFLKTMCHIFDKSAIRLYGRKGWWKYLKPLGFDLVDEVHTEGQRPSYIYNYNNKQEVANGR